MKALLTLTVIIAMNISLNATNQSTIQYTDTEYTTTELAGYDIMKLNSIIDEMQSTVFELQTENITMNDMIETLKVFEQEDNKDYSKEIRYYKQKIAVNEIIIETLNEKLIFIFKIINEVYQSLNE